MKKGRATIEEVTMIRDHMLLPAMITVLEKSLGEIERSRIALKDLNARFIQVMIDRVSADLHKLRRELRSRGIKLGAEEMMEEVLYQHYVCCGYEDKLGVVREVLRSEMRVRMTKYAGDIVKSTDRERP